MDMFDNKKDYLFAPSAVGLNTWESQTYAYGTTVSTQGDLRGPYGTYGYVTINKDGSDTEIATVTKLLVMTCPLELAILIGLII